MRSWPLAERQRKESMDDFARHGADINGRLGAHDGFAALAPFI